MSCTSEFARSTPCERFPSSWMPLLKPICTTSCGWLILDQPMAPSILPPQWGHRDASRLGWHGGQRRFLLDHCRSQGADWALMLMRMNGQTHRCGGGCQPPGQRTPPAISGAVLHRQLMVHGKPLNHVCQPERRLRLVRPEHASVVRLMRRSAEGNTTESKRREQPSVDREAHA